MCVTCLQSIHNSASIISEATANLPRICDDLDCTYPYGPACDLCTFDLDVKDQAKGRQQPKDWTTKWVEEVLMNKYITEYAGTPFLGSADEGRLDDGSVIADVVEEEEEKEKEEEDEDEVEEQVSEGDEMSEPDVESVCRSSPDYDADIDARSVSTQQAPRIQQSVYPVDSAGKWTSSSSIASLVPVAAAPNLQECLSPWLTDIFDRTLASQRKNTYFVGDADKENTEDGCPLCGNPLGPEELQHLIRCQYAHEERERMEKFGRNWRI